LADDRDFLQVASETRPARTIRLQPPISRRLSAASIGSKPWQRNLATQACSLSIEVVQRQPHAAIGTVGWSCCRARGGFPFRELRGAGGDGAQGWTSSCWGEQPDLRVAARSPGCCCTAVGDRMPRSAGSLSPRQISREVGKPPMGPARNDIGEVCSAAAFDRQAGRQLPLPPTTECT